LFGAVSASHGLPHQRHTPQEGPPLVTARKQVLTRSQQPQPSFVSMFPRLTVAPIASTFLRLTVSPPHCCPNSLNPGGAGPRATELPSPEQCKYKVLIKAKVGRFEEKEKKDMKISKTASVTLMEDEKKELEDQEETTIDELDDLVRVLNSSISLCS